MSIDPQVRADLDQMAKLALPPASAISPQTARAMMEAESRALGAPAPVGRVLDRTIPGLGVSGEIPIRVTSPEGEGPFPAFIYFHGGGWVVGSIATHDALCREITNQAGVAVVSVDYRLAPEHPYPSAVDDAYAATAWVAAHGASIGVDPARIAVGGDSAGGNLAAVVALRARDAGSAGPKITSQLLLYPITNDDLDTTSYHEFAEGYLLTREAMAWYWDQYAPGPVDRRQPYASPLRAEDLGGLPPALVIAAGYDVLRDEAEAYATRLAEAGNDVQFLRYDGMIHGFLRRTAIFDRAKDALGEVAEMLRSMLAP